MKSGVVSVTRQTDKKWSDSDTGRGEKISSKRRNLRGIRLRMSWWLSFVNVQEVANELSTILSVWG